MKQSCFLPVILLASTMLIFSCGAKNPIPELNLVPETALLHVHIEPGTNSEIRSFAGEKISGLILADSLLKSGPLGLTLVGVDITTLEPQLLLITQNVSIEYTSALAARTLNLDPRQEDNRIDLVSEEGYARAAVSERDGWTALYIGPAPHITIANWLDLDKDDSLEADTSLAKVIPEEAQITVLFPGNLFGFVSLLPLERQIPWWSDYKSLAEKVKPGALSLSLSWPEPDAEAPIEAGLMLARRGGGVSSIHISVTDTNINTDSCFILLFQLLEGVVH